jgi:phosphoribosylformylglycinamidine synthase
MEKLLLEACLELMATSAVVGIQDMGAAGLTSSSVEMAARAGSGVEIDLDRVPQRELGMTPYEILLSESQERMLMVLERGREAEALAIFAKWDLDAAVIGRVTESGRVVMKMDGETYADLPADLLAEGLRYDRPRSRPAYLARTEAWRPGGLAAPTDPKAALLALLGSPSIASKEWVIRQYDHEVRHGTVVRPGAAGAGIVRVLRDGDRPAKGVAIAAGCPQRMVYLAPFEGARLAIAEAYANLSAVGATPLAVTDCLNFGNPEKPEIMWQLAEAIRGLGDACRAFETPIVSGNVSLYNETDGVAIKPTPMIAMVGLLDDAARHATAGWKGAGDAIAVVGRLAGELGGSAYLDVVHGEVAGVPAALDPARDRVTCDAVRGLIEAGLLRSAHDVSDGGLVVALAECCVVGPEPLGARVVLEPPAGVRPDELWFGEAPARFVISFRQEDAAAVQRRLVAAGVAVVVVGQTGGGELVVEGPAGRLGAPLAELRGAWHGGFARALG